MGGYEGYITIASYDEQYVDFLSDKVPAAGYDSFMTMTEYGPFDLRRFPSLERFLIYIAVLIENPKP